MNSTGIVRRMDALGRLVLPIELRRNLNFQIQDSLEIFVDDDRIVLRKYQTACVFCGNANETIQLNGKNICTECLTAMGRKTTEVCQSFTQYEADDVIDKDKIKKMIAACLPKAESGTIESIACNIIRDTEAVISSMIRRAVSQEKEDLYKKNAI